jgi:hypothetical protein
VVWNASCFTITMDEVTIIDNGSWMSKTIYYVLKLCRESFNVKLEYIEEDGFSNNIVKIIMKVVIELIGMSMRDIAEKMLAFGIGKL